MIPAHYGPPWHYLGALIRDLYAEYRPTSVADLADLIGERAPDAPDAETVETVRYASRTILACCHRRTYRRTPPDRRKNLDAFLFHRAMAWHAGATGGSLWGPVGDQMLSPEAWERADTLAQVFRIALGLPMVSCDRWAHALGKDGAP
jgi:hypothetical protein